MDYRHLFGALLLLLLSCGQGKDRSNNAPSSNRLKHATNLSIEDHELGTVVTIHEPFKNASNSRKYLLVTGGNSPKDQSEHASYDEVIEVPTKSIAATATSQVGFLNMLDSGKSLTGFCSTNFIHAPAVRDRIDKGLLMELGPDTNLNKESLLTLGPDILIAYSVTGEIKQWEQISRLGIPVLFDASYLESSPLAQAEWIKFFGLLMGKEKMASAMFDAIEENYLSLTKLTKGVELRPAVIGGSMYSGTWYMPGGKSWVASYVHDAGGNYLWNDVEETGSIPLSFEAVFERSLDADLWIGATVFRSMDQLIAEDGRYLEFRAVKNGAIYSPTKRTNGLGGNDYYESGIAHPDLVLLDFTRIIQPDLLPDYQLHYYQELGQESTPRK